MKVSVDLFYRVMGVMVVEVKRVDKYIYYTYYVQPRAQDWKAINAHEFVAMCKDYIFQNYDLTLWTSRRTAKLNTKGVWVEMPRFVSDKGDFTDITAVLKATDWVLNAEEWNT